MAYSSLQDLAGIEALIRAIEPRVQFFFGPEEEHRNLAPPYVIWNVEGGDPTAFERRSPVTGTVSPKAFSADMMRFVAIIMGAPVPSAVDSERTRRAQEYAATEHLMLVLRWALQQSTSNGALGKHQWQGWTVIDPDGPESRGYKAECVFAVKVQVVAPEPLYADPPLTQTFEPIELES